MVIQLAIYRQQLIPNLTSDTLNPPIVVSASSVYSSNYAYKAVDGNSGTNWYQTAGYNSWWKIDFGLGYEKCVGKLSLISARVTTGVYSIKNWSLHASNDDLNYVMLTSNVHPNSVDRVEYEFVNTLKYRYYKIVIEDSYYNSGYTGIAELEMFEGDAPLLIKSEGKYYTYKNKEFIEVGPTYDSFMSQPVILSELLNPVEELFRPMGYDSDLEDGKVYFLDIDVKKFKAIKGMEVVQ